MTMCNKCGNPLDPSFRFCSGCGAPAPGWTGPEVTPSPETDKNDPPAQPPVDSAKGNEPVPHPIEERLKTLEESVIKWVNKNRRLSLLLAVSGLVVSIGSLWFVTEFIQRRKNPPPDAVFIEVEKNEVEAGAQLRLTAQTSPPGNLNCNFKWGPANLIEGSGALVWFKPPKDSRVSPYSVTVTLQTVDMANSPGPSAERSITVLPEGRTNNKPEFNPGEGIHIEGSLEVQSGASINLDAVAFDRDGDPLKYTWSVESGSVQIERNGDRRVTLKLPKDFARRGNVSLNVKLIVSDGKGGFSESQHATITVTPQGHLQISRSKRAGNQRPTPSPATPSQPAKPTSPPLAVPQATQAGEKLDQVSRP